MTHLDGWQELVPAIPLPEYSVFCCVHQPTSIVGLEALNSRRQGHSQFYLISHPPILRHQTPRPQLPYVSAAPLVPLEGCSKQKPPHSVAYSPQKKTPTRAVPTSSCRGALGGDPEPGPRLEWTTDGRRC